MSIFAHDLERSDLLALEYGEIASLQIIGETPMPRVGIGDAEGVYVT